MTACACGMLCGEIGSLRDTIVSWLASMFGSMPFAWIITGGIFAGAIVGLVCTYGALAVYAERKIMSFMQCRLGPMEVGPDVDVRIAGLTVLPKGWYGLGTIIGDGIKLLGKEDIVPAKADRLLFLLAPYIIFAAIISAFSVMPFAAFIIPSAVDAGVIVILASSSIAAVGIVMGGYSSNNKWSMYGSIRSVAQFISYEVPMGLALLAVIVTTGSLSLAEIAAAQAGWFWHWHAFTNIWLFLAAVVYFISSLAETNRTPFDIPEAESELVAGYHTEYSGMRFALFMFAEYINMFLASLVASIFFFGGYSSGIAFLDRFPILGPFVLGAKALVMVFVFIWLRWTLPRFRVDQLMSLCWKALLPLAIISFTGAAAAALIASVYMNIFGKLLIVLAVAAFAVEVRRRLRSAAARGATS